MTLRLGLFMVFVGLGAVFSQFGCNNSGALVVADSGAPAAEMDASSSAGSDASCQLISQSARDVLTPVILSAEKAPSCTSDDNCSWISDDSDCTASCGALVNLKGAAAIASAVEQVNRDVCPNFTQAGCQLVHPPCIAFPSLSACIAGICVNFPPARWKSLVIDRYVGGGVRVPADCSVGSDCTVWTVTPDGAVAKLVAGAPSVATLSPADLAVVDGLLRSEEFRRKEMSGFPCPEEPQHVSLQTTRDMSTSGQNIEGCLNGRDADLTTLYRIVSGY